MATMVSRAYMNINVLLKTQSSICEIYISMHSQHVSIMHIKHLLRRENACKHTEDDDELYELIVHGHACITHQSQYMQDPYDHTDF